MTSDESQIIVQEVKAAWESLSYREREMLKLRYALADEMQFSESEIGNIFGIKPSTVRVYIRRALQRFLKLLKSKSTEGAA